MKFLILLLTTFNFSSVSHALSCNKIDLRSKLGPVQNQDGTGLCFAYAASEIASFKLGRRVSAIDISQQYFKRYDKKMYQTKGEKYYREIVSERQSGIAEGGLVKESLEYASDVGFCSDEKASSNVGGGSNLLKGLSNLNKLELKKFNLETASKADCEKFASIQKIFPGVSMQDLQDVANKSTIMNIGSNVADQACQPRLKPQPSLNIKSINNRNNTRENLSNEQFAEVNKILSREQPLSISVYMDSLYKYDKSDSGEIGRHAMTLVGREYNSTTGQCDYIIKNSFGPECDSSYKVRCKDGYMFLSEAQLKSVMYAADYIE